MKIRLANKEQLDVVFGELRSTISIRSDEQERQFAMFKKIVRGNVEIYNDAEENRLGAEMAEKEEARDQKVVGIAFQRLETVAKCRRDYEENCAAVKREISDINDTFETGELFSLRRREHEPDEFKDMAHHIKALKERTPEVSAKMDRARRVLEDESRKSVGVRSAMHDNPLKAYFDLK